VDAVDLFPVMFSFLEKLKDLIALDLDHLRRPALRQRPTLLWRE
jgi:hypothetical protein